MRWCYRDFEARELDMRDELIWKSQSYFSLNLLYSILRYQTNKRHKVVKFDSIRPTGRLTVGRMDYFTLVIA